MNDTVTIDADILPKLRERAEAEHVTLEEFANQFLRSVVVDPAKAERIFKVGDRYFTLAKAMALADALDDEERIRKMKLGQ